MQSPARTAAVSLTALFALAAGGLVGSSALGSTDADGVQEACLGLACASAEDRYAVPEAKGQVPSVGGPEDLAAQRSAGFYEYGRGTSVGERAVAFVVPRGQYASVPASVRKLPVVATHLANKEFESGTVVIFGPSVSLFAPAGAKASRARAERKGSRPSARAAAADQWGCEDNYFCIYSATEWEGTRLQFGPPFASATLWFNLGDYAFNDRADSMRNRRDADSFLARDTGGNGTRYCADSHSSDTTFGNNPIDTDQASSLANRTGDGHC